MKKILLLPVVIVIVLAIISCFSLAGCKTEEEVADEAAEEAAEEQVEEEPVEEEAVEEEAVEEPIEEEEKPYAGQTISFLSYPWLTYAPEEIQKFTELTGITVELETLGFDELNTKVTASSAAGVAPADVFTQYEGSLSGIVGAGYTEPLNDYISDELLGDMLALENFTYDGKLLGLPLFYNVYLCMANMAKLEEAGFDKTPETTDELVEMCMDIKEQGIDEYPYMAPLIADTASTKEWYMIVYSYGGELFDENYQPLFVSDEGRAALEFLIDNIGVIIDPAMIETTNVERNEMYMGGRGTFCLGGYGSVIQYNIPDSSEVAGNIAAMLIPGNEDNRSGSVNIADGFAMSSLSENKEAAWEFMKWILSDDTVINAFKNMGVIPSRKSMLASLDDQGLLLYVDIVEEQASYAKPMYPSGLATWDGQWQKEAGTFINSAARGTITIDEALQKMADLALELQQQ